MAERTVVWVAVYILFRKKDEVLLLRRYNTGYADGNYSIPAGHVDAGELPLDASVREAWEEVNVKIKKNNLKLVHVMHRIKTGEPYDRIDYFFECEKWEGEITNNEPHKCDELKWFEIANLPSNVIPSLKQAIEKYQAGETFSEFVG